MAELYPILVHCQTMVSLNTLLSVFHVRCRQPIRIEYYVTQKPRELSTKVQVPIFYGRLRLERVNLINVIRWGTALQCNKTGNTTAILQDWELFSNVSRTGYISAVFYDWEKLSNVIGRDMTQQCYKIRNSSAM